MIPTGETDLQKLLKALKPTLNQGEFVFCSIDGHSHVNLGKIKMFFKEEEGNTIIIEKELADRLKLFYPSVMCWITLTVHSSLTAVGLTAAFSKALAEKGISCNVVSAFYHDHIFVEKKDAEEAVIVLTHLSEKGLLL